VDVIEKGMVAVAVMGVDLGLLPIKSKPQLGRANMAGS
jgi:hypothetical protein